MQNFLVKFMPFLILGFMIVILIAGFVLLSYLLIFSALVGVLLFAIAWVKNKFFPVKDLTTKPPKSGRIIDHDDL